MKTMEEEFQEKYEAVNEENIKLKKDLEASNIKITELETTINVLFGGTSV